jgi:hypothetical protein
MSLPGAFLPGTMTDSIMFYCYMHIHGGGLYGINKIGQMLYLRFMLLNGLNPSVAKPNLIFLGSLAKFLCNKSKFFQAGESAGCLNMPSFVLPS